MDVGILTRKKLELVETGYRTPREVLAALEEVRDKGWDLEANEALVTAVRQIYSKTGREMENVGVVEALRAVKELPEEAMDREIADLETGQKKESRVPTEKLEQLMDEYQQKLKEGEEREEAVAKAVEEMGKGQKGAARKVLERFEEVKQEAMEILGAEEGVEAAEEITALEETLEEVLPKEVIKEIVRGSGKKIEKVLEKNGVKEEAREEIVVMTEEIKQKVAAEMTIGKEIEKIAARTAEKMGQPEKAREMAAQLRQQVIKGEEKEGGTTIERAAREEVRAAAGKFQREARVMRTEAMREEIIRETERINPEANKVEKLTIRRYARLLARYYNSDAGVEVGRWREETEEYGKAEGMTPGQTRVAWEGTETTAIGVKMGQKPFENFLKAHGEITANLGRIKLPFNLGRVRAVETLVSTVRASPEVAKWLTAAQKVSGFYQKIDGITGGLLSGKIVETTGLKIVGMIGQQTTNVFLKNALLTISQQGLATGLKTVLAGIVGGGVKAGVGAAAAAGAGAGAAAMAAGPPGWLVAAGIAVATVGKKIFDKVKDFLGGIWRSLGVEPESLRLLGGVKNWMRANLPGILGKAGGFLVDLAEVPLVVVAVGLAGIGTGIGVVVAAVFLGIFGFQMLVTAPFLAAVKPQEQTGRGAIAEETTSGRGAGERVEAKCQSRDWSGLVRWEIKQNKGDWANKSLPRGCTFTQSACGPTSVAKVVMTKDSSLNPEKVVFEAGSPFGGMGCEGVSLSQIKESLEKHLGGGVTYDGTTRSCSKKDIADWICDGKIVVMLGNFYNNNGIGGHFALAVRVDNGQVYLSDPYYNDQEEQMDGQNKWGHVESILSCLVIDTGNIK